MKIILVSKNRLVVILHVGDITEHTVNVAGKILSIVLQKDLVEEWDRLPQLFRQRPHKVIPSFERNDEEKYDKMDRAVREGNARKQRLWHVKSNSPMFKTCKLVKEVSSFGIVPPILFLAFGWC